MSLLLDTHSMLNDYTPFLHKTYLSRPLSRAITDLNNSGPKLQADRLVYPKEGIYFFQIRPKTSQVSAAADS